MFNFSTMPLFEVLKDSMLFIIIIEQKFIKWVFFYFIKILIEIAKYLNGGEDLSEKNTAY